MSAWEEAKADSLEAQATTIEETIVALTRVEGMHEVLSERRSEITSLAKSLQDDADSLRREADGLRKSAKRREVNV